MIALGPTEERALILTCPGLEKSVDLHQLASGGVNGFELACMDHLHPALQQGAGLLIVEADSRQSEAFEQLSDVLLQQPDWSDLAVIVLTAEPHWSDLQLSHLSEQLGNAFFVASPWSHAQLLCLSKNALRTRKQQYAARDCTHRLSERDNFIKNTLQAIDLEVDRRVEKALQHNDDVRHAQKMEAVGQLTGGIAHDLNNMLAGIIGSMELLRRKVARGKLDDLDRLIDMGVTSANCAAGLTHRLLAFSRRQSLDSKPTMISEWLLAQRALLEQNLAPATQLTLEADDNLWIADVDPQQLENALLHLVSNARDAMPEDGHLTVKTYNVQVDTAFSEANGHFTPGDYIVLSASDNGCGMQESTLKRAFDPFFTTKPIGQGTGLGLSMIYGFCKQSRGHVRIISQERSGTTVQLFLPRCNGSSGELSAQGLSQAETAANAEKTLLVVEDDNAVRSLVIEVLREHGYTVLSAEDANAALPIIESAQAIDLLISDVGLPGMNGRQLAEISRQARPDLKVLFITGYAQHATARGGFLDEGMQLITKPFTFDLLTAKVNEMLLA